MVFEVLRKIIDTNLLPIIGKRVVLLEVPYYLNIGDLLIWKGELEFLKRNKKEVLYSSSSYNMDFSKKIDSNVTILLQGGGNFGDLWKEPHDFRKKVIEQYPKNKIVIFPQTIFYTEEKALLEDVEFFSKYRNVIICARDERSYNILQKNFVNKSLLLPDMAFYINIKTHILNKSERVLYAQRLDEESLKEMSFKGIPQNAEVHDWPTFEGLRNVSSFLSYITRCAQIVDRLCGTKLCIKITDYYWLKIRMPKFIKIGIDFINEYGVIYTTRLHIGILGLLLGKQVFFLDNSYGKLSGFYNSWLKNIKNASLVDNE